MGTLLSLLLALHITGQERPQNSHPKAGPMVRFEVLIADLAEPANEPTAASILELEKTGKLKSLQRLQLTTLEQQLASVQIGQLVQRVSGQMAAAGGRGGPAIGGRGFAGGGFVGGAAVPRFSSVNVGTTMSVTPRIENDGSIAAQLTLLIISLADDPQPAANADAPPPPQGVDRLMLETTLHLQPGEPQLISAKQNRDGKEGQTVWIVITAHVGPPK